MLFELNYNYHLYVFFQKNTNPCFQSRFANELSYSRGEKSDIYLPSELILYLKTSKLYI